MKTLLVNEDALSREAAAARSPGRQPGGGHGVFGFSREAATSGHALHPCAENAAASRLHAFDAAHSGLTPGATRYRRFAAIAVTSFIVIALAFAVGCDRSSPGNDAGDGADGGADDAQQAMDENAAPAAGIAIPPTVRENFGVTFEEVQLRHVDRTLRFPGQFELRPEARREYRAMLSGRVRLHVEQYEQVAANQLLATIESAEWRQMLHETVEAAGEIKLAEAAIDVAQSEITETKQAATFVEQRIDALGDVRRIELESQLASLNNKLPSLEAKLRAANVKLDEAKEHYDSKLGLLSAIVGEPVNELRQPSGSSNVNGEPVARWQTLQQLELRADAAGIVDTIDVTQGEWVANSGGIMNVVDPSSLRFHGHAPQTDLGKLSTGQPARVVPPQGGSIPLGAAMEGTARLGFRGHPSERTIPLYLTPKEGESLPAWAKPGVTAYIEVVIEGTTEPKLAIPLSAVVRDELQLIFFRRDARDADKAIREVADLGIDDGRWVVVNSGVVEGDQVVVEGAYALKLVGSKKQAPPGYHYHADGTLHKNH